MTQPDPSNSFYLHDAFRKSSYSLRGHVRVSQSAKTHAGGLPAMIKHTHTHTAAPLSELLLPAALIHTQVRELHLVDGDGAGLGLAVARCDGA